MENGIVSQKEPKGLTISKSAHHWLFASSMELLQKVGATDPSIDQLHYISPKRL